MLCAAALSCGREVGTGVPIAQPAIDVREVQQLEVEDQFCGASPTSCAHLAVSLVDFDAGVLEKHTCVEGADGGSGRWGPRRGDAVSARLLSGAQLASVRDAISRLTFDQQPLLALDGAMTTVTVRTSTSTWCATPQATCGPDPYAHVASGYEELRRAFDGL